MAKPPVRGVGAAAARAGGDGMGLVWTLLPDPEAPSSMHPHLFVYGSLLSTAHHPMGARLRREARSLGAATLQGRLYRVHWYPAAIDSADPTHRVHGEVYALHDPTGTLAWLDAYEGIAPSGEAGEYRRVERPVRLATGAGEGVGDLALIADGRWQAGAGEG
jgi:gamma-glutamylcyclotransferase (GGCT)/AIG2-like uncharacterized protein YtfP